MRLDNIGNYKLMNLRRSGMRHTIMLRYTKNELRYFMIEQSLENYFYLIKFFFCITLNYIYFLKILDLDGQGPI